ncbi:hypothetical protein ES703_86712 [subsurface metagenome]
MELDIRFSPVAVETGQLDAKEQPITRSETMVELVKRTTDSVQALRQVLEGNTADDLYRITGEQKLINPFKDKDKIAEPDKLIGEALVAAMAGFEAELAVIKG